MIDFSGKTQANILSDMLSLIPDTYDKRDMSPISTALGPAAWALAGVYIALGQMQDNAFLGTATGEDLDKIAAIAGVTRKAATPAVRLGTFNTAISEGDRFSTMNGSNSINFIATSGSGTSWELTAETPGIIGNSYTGDILPISVIPGLTSATITDIISAGSDTETDEELRTRIRLALVDKPFAGNIASYREMLLEMTEADGTAVNLGGVQVYPVWNGPGTVKCSVVDSQYKPITNTLVGHIQNAVDPSTLGLGTGLAPIGAQVTITTPSALHPLISATIAHTTGTTMASLTPKIEAAIDEYLDSINREWGIAEATDMTLYKSVIYLARITSAVLSVSGVTNVTNVKINGSAADYTLTENSTTQKIITGRSITLTEAS